MTTDDLGKQPDNAIPFLLARAQAIDAYAQVERWLNFLFSNLLGTPHDIGGIVFFRITNSSSRLAIIDFFSKDDMATDLRRIGRVRQTHLIDVVS